MKLEGIGRKLGLAREFETPEKAAKAKAAAPMALKVHTEHSLRASGEARLELPADKVTQSLVRHLKSALEFRLGTAVPDDHDLMIWLVRHALAQLVRHVVGPDGRTPMERYNGGACAGLMAEFGERIWWLPLQRSGNGWPSWGARFDDGWYLGSCEGSKETLVLTPTGVVRTRIWRRRPLSERWTKEMLKCTASEVQFDAWNRSEARIWIQAPVAQESVPEFPTPLRTRNFRRRPLSERWTEEILKCTACEVQPPLPADDIVIVPRRAKLVRKCFVENGLTPGCNGCSSIRKGFKRNAGHDARCRERMEALLAQDPAGKARLENAQRRLASYAELEKQNAQRRLASYAELEKDEQQAKRSRTDDVEISDPGAAASAAEARIGIQAPAAKE